MRLQTPPEPRASRFLGEVLRDRAQSPRPLRVLEGLGEVPGLSVVMREPLETTFERICYRGSKACAIRA